MKRLLSVFARFRAAHLVLSGKPATMGTPAGEPIGAVRTVTLQRGKLVVTGQAPAGAVELSLGRMTTHTTLPGGGGDFRLELPCPTTLPIRQLRAKLVAAGAEPLSLRLGHPGPALLKLTGRFGLTLLRLLPDLIHWKRTGASRSKARIKALLGLTQGDVVASLLPDSLFLRYAAAPIKCGCDQGVTIVLPVFKALDMLRVCLDRLERHTDLRWKVIIIDDGSQDPELRTWLTEFAARRPQGQVRLILQEENRGFIASVNKAFEIILADGQLSQLPIVLLNSDAWVPAGWASRLLQPMLEDPTIASVTPMSNDAEIFTVPTICQPLSLQPGQADAIDALARHLAPKAAVADAPTGVGFCMALSPHYLRQVPRFDTSFGRGYGEEVDWCQKVRALGGRHIGTARLFVEHHGGGSFGSAQKAALIARNNQIIAGRYPQFDREVQDVLAQDPWQACRLALALTWAGTVSSDQMVPIYLAHSMGGGAEQWLRGQIDQEVREDRPVVVLRVGGSARWQIELWGPKGCTAGQTEDTALVQQLLQPLQRRRIIYSCGVGDRDPVSLPELLLALRQGERDQLEVLFHDYLPISPSFTLLDGAGQFHGAVTPHRLDGLSEASATAHATCRPDGQPVALEQWQVAWGRLLRQANVLRAFSPAVADILGAVWPDLAGRISILPHRLLTEVPRLPALPSTAPPVLAVLGNIAPHKGAALVQQLARMSRDRRGGDLVVIGNIDPDYPLPRTTRLHGDYNPADLPVLAAYYGVTHWLIPSLWPETFSYTTHEALNTGRPVLAFDIGAQGAAVRAAANGIAVPYQPGGDHARCIAEAFRAGGAV